jgi:hypothetical protein
MTDWASDGSTAISFLQARSPVLGRERLKLIIVERKNRPPVDGRWLKDPDKAAKFLAPLLPGTRGLFLVDPTGKLSEGSAEVFDELWQPEHLPSSIHGHSFVPDSPAMYPEYLERLPSLARKHHDRALLALLGEKE